MAKGVAMGNTDILLVEDDADYAELTLRALRLHSGREAVFHVEDGARAIEFIFAQGEFCARDDKLVLKLILLDLKLPKIDGLEVLRRIKSDRRTRCIPVVMFTSSSEPADVRQCYALGGNSYVVKPVGFVEYIEKIAAIARYWSAHNRGLDPGGQGAAA